MKYTRYIAAFFMLALLSVRLLAGNKGASLSSKSESDTVSVRVPEFMKSDLSYNDSVALFPAYETYCSWNTEKIHFNQYTGLTFDETYTIDLCPENCNFVMPVKNKINSNFGYRRGRPHFGIDIDLNTGDTVVAAFDGMVRYAKRDRGYGNLVVVRHTNGLETYYGHLSKINVEVGQNIKAGELLGLGGNTGRSTGAHLHFETRFKGLALNPNCLIDFENNKLCCENYLVNAESFAYLKEPRYKKGKRGYYAKRTRSSKNVSGVAFASKKSSPKKGSQIIRKGDTVYSIAKRTGTTVEAIYKKNGMSSSSKLKVGSVIRY